MLQPWRVGSVAWCLVALFCLAASMAAGQENAKTTGTAEASYGRELPVVEDLHLGPCMDAAVEGNWLYAIGQGKLFVADISTPNAPRVVGTLADLGRTRQIVVKDQVAYITSREDGMFLVDVSRPREPRLLSHYDTIELATGIAVSGPVAFVACRTYGVELVDVSDPARPAHLSTVRTGEAQSCIARDGILYAGVWETQELVICDVQNPRKPAIIARAPLDGYGDGVDLRGKYCYVSTGHHARGVKRPREHNMTRAEVEADPAYGRGHGLEIFDVSDPRKPVWVSRIKSPRIFSLRHLDAWSVTVEGRYAVMADTCNGMFVVDVSDPTKPRFVAHRQWPRAGVVAGLALGKDHVYVAGPDLSVVDATGLASPQTAELDHAPTIPPPVEASDPRFRVYDPAGQVYAVALSGDVALVAAGGAGLHEVRILPKIEKLHAYKTAGFAMDVKVVGNHVFVAEGEGGLSIWERPKDGPLTQVARYRVPSSTVRQVVVPPPGKYALLHVGFHMLHILDVSDPAQPRLVLKEARPGCLYGYHIAEGLLDARYACCGWAYGAYYWYDLYGGPVPAFSGDKFPLRFDAHDGMAFLDGKALVIHQGKYFLLDRKESRPPESLPRYGIPGHELYGKPSIYGNRLYVSDRFWGKVSVVDVSRPESPRLLRSIQLDGNPGIIAEHNGTLVIPAGYQGLLIDAEKSK
jgi:hypothetical protein